jgi:hypothetical protein
MSDQDPADPILDLEERRRQERAAVDEAGGGESEGFELAEEELVEHASHGDQHTPSQILEDAAGPGEDDSGAVYGEADEEQPPD